MTFQTRDHTVTVKDHAGINIVIEVSERKGRHMPIVLSVVEARALAAAITEQIRQVG